MEIGDCINKILVGDCIETMKKMPACSVHCCVTSPPYWGLRDYGVKGQFGLEKTPAEFVEKMAAVFREVWRVLRDDGTLWLNLGDSYAGGGCGARDIERWPKQSRNDHMATHSKKFSGLKFKDLVGMPWHVAFALQAAGWYLRSDIIWSKPNPMPESTIDRPTKAHEYLFLLSKSQKYFYDSEAIREDAAPESAERYKYDFGGQKAETLTREEADGPGTRTHPIGARIFKGKRNKRTVWTVTTKPYSEAHFATFPTKLIEPCILAGTSEKGICTSCGAQIRRIVKREGGRDWRNDQMKSKGIPGELAGEGSYKRGQSSTSYIAQRRQRNPIRRIRRK